MGSWKQVRVLTENLDDQGNVISTTTTDTTTTLLAVDKRSYTLRVQVTVEVAGKRFVAQPKTVKKGFDGEEDGQQVTLKKIGSGHVVVGGETIPSEVKQITVNGGGTKRVTTVYYSDRVAPYVLKRHTTATDLRSNSTRYWSRVDVLALAMPYKVLSQVKSVSFVRTVHQRPKGKTITLEVYSPDVPGGVVAHTSKETDETGRVIRRSTLELVDYGIANGERRPLGHRLLDHLRRRLQSW